MTANAPILFAESLAKRFGSRLVLDDVSFSLRQGDLLAIVGESGSGKSTLLRCLAMLEQPDDGLVRFHGQPVHVLRRTRTTDFRRRVQLVMQDAAMAMNPAWQALRIVREPLDILRRDLSVSQRDEMAVASLQHVGLDASFISRFPRELSGGQRQRLQIARALSLQPELLLLDEPFAGLDTPVQADLLALLQQLRRTRALTCVIVTHDLELACWASTALLLLHRGRLLRHIPAPANPAFTNFRQRAAAYSDYAAFLDDLVERTEYPPQGISNAEDQAP